MPGNSSGFLALPAASQGKRSETVRSMDWKAHYSALRLFDRTKVAHQIVADENDCRADFRRCTPFEVGCDVLHLSYHGAAISLPSMIVAAINPFFLKRR